MKLSDYVIKYLSFHTSHVFTGQGGCIIHLMDSLSKSKLAYTPCHHEQCAAFAAEAYARVSGKLGVVIATSGPGMINTIQGIASSYFDSVPLLVIIGAVPTSHLKGDQPVRQMGFQEMDVIGIVKPITKYAVLLKDAKDITQELDNLINAAFTGRQGPVVLDLPDDLQRTEI